METPVQKLRLCSAQKVSACLEMIFSVSVDSAFKLTLFAEFDDIVESFDVDPDCERHILLTHCRQ